MRVYNIFNICVAYIKYILFCAFCLPLNIPVDAMKLFTINGWYYWAKIITGSSYTIPCTVTDPRINVTLEYGNEILSEEGSVITYDPRVGFKVPGDYKYTQYNDNLICKARKGNLTQIKKILLNFEREYLLFILLNSPSYFSCLNIVNFCFFSGSRCHVAYCKCLSHKPYSCKAMCCKH